MELFYKTHRKIVVDKYYAKCFQYSHIHSLAFGHYLIKEMLVVWPILNKIVTEATSRAEAHVVKLILNEIVSIVVSRAEETHPMGQMQMQIE